MIGRTHSRSHSMAKSTRSHNSATPNKTPKSAHSHHNTFDFKKRSNIDKNQSALFSDAQIKKVVGRTRGPSSVYSQPSSQPSKLYAQRRSHPLRMKSHDRSLDAD